MKYTIYTDGAASNNGQADAVGGWAFVILNEEESPIYIDKGRILNTTNNICELTAIIKACKAIQKIFLQSNDIVEVYSDSAYCINCANQKWYKTWELNGWRNSQKKPVANKELWEQLIPFFEDYHFKWIKVSGHSGNKWNEFVDTSAVSAKLGYSMRVD